MLLEPPALEERGFQKNYDGGKGFLRLWNG